MRTPARAVTCARRRRPTLNDLTAWARSVIAFPAAHGATPREAVIVASLLSELEATS